MSCGRIRNQEVLCQVALNDESPMVRASAVLHIDDEDVLESKGLDDDNRNVRLNAISRISNQEVLMKIAVGDEYPYNRQRAFKKLDSQSVLSLIYDVADESMRAKRLREFSKWGIRDDILVDIALNDENQSVRQCAISKIKGKRNLEHVIDSISNPYLKRYGEEKYLKEFNEDWRYERRFVL